MRGAGAHLINDQLAYVQEEGSNPSKEYLRSLIQSLRQSLFRRLAAADKLAPLLLRLEAAASEFEMVKNQIM